MSKLFILRRRDPKRRIKAYTRLAIYMKKRLTDGQESVTQYLRLQRLPITDIRLKREFYNLLDDLDLRCL